MTEYKNLAEFYYNLEDALDERSAVSEGLENIECFHLNKKIISQDPYLEFLNLKYGLVGPIEYKKTFKLLNEIEDGAVEYEPWKKMGISIQAFVTNQLSLFYLGYQGATQRDLEISTQYLNDSINLGNRRAMFSKAEEIFNDINIEVILQATTEMHGEFKFAYTHEKNKLDAAIELFKKAEDAGHKFVYASLIDCYKITYQFSECVRYYDILINELHFDGYICAFIDEYERAMKHDNCYTKTRDFIGVLLKSKFEKAHLALVKYSHVVTEEILDQMLEYSNNEVILNNLLLIFNSNNLLYQKYIHKLLSSYSAYKQIKNITNARRF